MTFSILYIEIHRVLISASSCTVSANRRCRRQGRPQDFFPGEGHRRRKGSVVGGHHGECGARADNGSLGAEHFGHWMSNGAGKFSPCICISTQGATVMTWEKFLSKSRGSGDPRCPFLGAPMVDVTGQRTSAPVLHVLRTAFGFSFLN